MKGKNIPDDTYCTTTDTDDIDALEHELEEWKKEHDKLVEESSKFPTWFNEVSDEGQKRAR